MSKRADANLHTLLVLPPAPCCKPHGSTLAMGAVNPRTLRPPQGRRGAAKNARTLCAVMAKKERLKPEPA